MTDKNNWFTMTDNEIQEYLDDSKKHVESNHPIDDTRNFMEMITEGCDISLALHREKRKQAKKNDTKKC